MLAALAETREARRANAGPRARPRRRNAGVSSVRKATCRLAVPGSVKRTRQRHVAAGPGAAEEHVARPSVQFSVMPSRSLPLPSPINDAMYHTYRSDLSQVRAL